MLTGLALGPRTSGGGPQLVWAQLLSCLKPETLLRLRLSVLFSSPQGCHTSSRRASLLVPLSASRTLATCLGFGAYLRTFAGLRSGLIALVTRAPGPGLHTRTCQHVRGRIASPAPAAICAGAGGQHTGGNPFEPEGKD